MIKLIRDFLNRFLREDQQELTEIKQLLNRILIKEEFIMANMQVLIDAVAAQTALIDRLVAAGGVDQAAIDSIVTSVQANNDKLTALSANIPTP